jgi:hypothetical protein
VADDIHTLVRPHIDTLLDAGETVEGICIATQQSAFKGSMVALAVTDRRLLVQPLDRKANPKGDLVSITPDQVAKAGAIGMGDEWYNTDISMLGDVALTLRLQTAGGEKLKLNMMQGGDGMLGRLGGGESQQAGVAALAGWLQRNPPRG